MWNQVETGEAAVSDSNTCLFLVDRDINMIVFMRCANVRRRVVCNVAI